MRRTGLPGALAAALAAGLAFLYLPIVLLVVFSFNGSRLVTVWAGFSTDWYAALLRNEPLRAAAWTSLTVGLASASLATVLGTLAALALAGRERFPGRRWLAGSVLAPMVLPEVILGLSLLLLFVALGIERGAGTVVVAHATLTLPFVAAIVGARLVQLDRSLGEAAADLGATPLSAFATVTLPLAAPSVAAGFLLAFTLSLDDLVVASFTSGPGATTLPMFVFSQVRRGVTPEVNAISSLMILAAAVAIGTAMLATRSRRISGAGSSPSSSAR